MEFDPGLGCHAYPGGGPEPASGVGSPAVVAVVLADGEVRGDDAGVRVAEAEGVRDVAADGGDAAGAPEAHPLSTTAQDTARTARDERLVQDRGAGRGTVAVWRPRV